MLKPMAGHNPELRPTSGDEKSRFDRKAFAWGILVGAGTVCIGIAAIAFFAVAGRAMLARYFNRNEQSVSMGDFATMLQSGKVKSVIIDAGEMHGEFTTDMVASDGRRFRFFHTNVPANAGSHWSFNQFVLDHKGNASVEITN